MATAKTIKTGQLDNQDFDDYSSPLPRGRGHYIWLLVAGKGRGKSTCLINAISQYYKGFYDRIYLVSPSAQYDDKFGPLLEELNGEGQFFDKYSDGLIGEIMDRIQHADEAKTLLILDDVISELPKSTQKGSALNKLITAHRHFKTDIWITSQKFNKLNTLIRNNFDVISLWGTVNKNEQKSITDELNVDKDEFITLLDALEDKHDWLTISFLDGNPRWYHKFSEIKFSE